jgi:hypothetical protein
MFSCLPGYCVEMLHMCYAKKTNSICYHAEQESVIMLPHECTDDQQHVAGGMEHDHWRNGPTVRMFLILMIC